jgi:hypothetical protein
MLRQRRAVFIHDIDTGVDYLPLYIHPGSIDDGPGSVAYLRTDPISGYPGNLMHNPYPLIFAMAGKNSRMPEKKVLSDKLSRYHANING